MFGVETRGSKIQTMKITVKQLKKEVNIERQKISVSAQE